LRTKESNLRVDWIAKNIRQNLQGRSKMNGCGEST
jgi:hypothetical protein